MSNPIDERNAIYVNEWRDMYDTMAPHHKMIIDQTLPTEAFALLLGIYVKTRKDQLANLDIMRPDADFKDKYRAIKLRQELAEGLANFVKTLQPTTTDD